MQEYKKPRDLPLNDFIFNLWHMCRVIAYVRGRKMETRALSLKELSE